MHITFDHLTRETEHISTFFFVPERPVNYTAGQFVELTLPHIDTDDRGDKRWFTLSSSPTDELISITTKFAPEHSSSFKRTLGSMIPGTQLLMSDPLGDFVLPKFVQTPLIFVAGGIGITPFHSMLTWLAETHETRPVRLLYAVESEDDIIFQSTFEKAHQHATILVNHASAAWGGERGQLTAEKIIGLEQPSDDTLIYIAGPEPLVESLQKDLKATGIEQRQLVLDFFPHYPTV